MGAFMNLPKLDTILADVILSNKMNIEVKAFQDCPLIYAINYIYNLSSIKQSECYINCKQTCNQIHYNFLNNFLIFQVFVLIFI